MRHNGLSANPRGRRALNLFILPALAAAGITSGASAQWATFVNDTANRIVGTPATSTADPEEKDYAWADLDNDGDIDLVVVRKTPFTFFGGRPNVLFMNENGVLVDRTSTLAASSINVPAAEITQANTMPNYAQFTPYWPASSTISRGFLDPTNDRDVVIADVNNDGWLDVVTATTISDVKNPADGGGAYYLPRFLGHPRVYMNKGSVGGVWQGLEYDYNRFPQLVSKTGTPWHPRFCSVAIGDVTGDGYADLYFGDYDTAEIGPAEPAGTDMDNKLLINMGAANPGVFVDQSVMRMGNTYNYPNYGNGNYLVSAFGAASVIADMNGDGNNDVVKQTGLNPPQHIGISYNDPNNVGMFNRYSVPVALSPYFVSVADLNNDNRLDFIVSDDNADHYHLNQSNAGDGTAIFSSANFAFASGSDDGFGSQSVSADLDNDGFKDVLISDVDVDAFGCARRTHIYHNLGNVPNVTLREESPSIIATNMLNGTHNIAAFDINNDGWVDLVFGRCNSMEVWMNTGTKVLVPSAPTQVNPTSGTNFTVEINHSAAAPIVAGSARLYYSVNGGAYAFSPLTPTTGNFFTASLPAGACGDEIRYYVSVQVNPNGTPVTFTNPANAPTNAFAAIRATGVTITLDEAFEGSVAGWSVVNDPTLTSGAWQAADPVGTINSGAQAAPEDDATPDPGVVAFITQNGAVGGAAGSSDIDGGPTTLLSPTLDASNGAYRITYAYWFYTSDTVSPSTTDTMVVSVSNNNGASWVPVKTIGTTSNGWVRDGFLISQFVSPTNQIRVRFAANDTGTGTVVEAGLDDFRMEKAQCAVACPADITGDGSVGVSDLLAVIAAWGPCPAPPTACPADINADASVNVADLLGVIVAWGACPS